MQRREQNSSLFFWSLAYREENGWREKFFCNNLYKIVCFLNYFLFSNNSFIMIDLHWKNFIENFIEERQFDPLVADNWYQMARDKIIEVGEVLN
jgi:hypothetical protein